jgi:DNA-binding transcriptional regulator YiaG
MSKEIKNSEENSKRSEDYTERSKENLVKKTCRELGITQKELAERIGVSDSTVRHWNSNNEIPNIAQNFMSLLLENRELNNRFIKVKDFLFLIDELKGIQKMNTL